MSDQFSAPQSNAGGGTDPYGSSAPQYGQQSYGQSSAPQYGQPSASSAPQYGQQAYGQGSAGSFGQPSAPGGWATQGASYAAPPAGPKKRGMVRIVLGSIIMVLGLIGLAIGWLIGLGIGAAVSITNISGDSVTTVASGDQLQLDDGIYFIGSTSSSATCTAEGQRSIDVRPQDSSSFTFTKDGKTYYVRAQATTSAATDATVSCTSGDVAIAPVGFTGVLVGLALGIGLPLLFFLAGLILLISGIIGRSRSKRQAA